MAASKYKVYLYDIRTQEIFAEVPKAAIKYDYEMDEAGSATVSIPTKSLKLDGTKLTFADVFPCRTALAIQRGDKLEWGGLIWTYGVDFASKVLEFGVGGYLSYYRYRHTNVKGNKFKNKLTTEIVKWFILESNSGATAGNGINTNTSELKSVGIRRTEVWNPYEYKTIEAIVQDMADEVATYDPQTLKYGGGFFFYFEPYFVDDTHIGHRLRNTESRHPEFNGITLRQAVNCEFAKATVDGTAMANQAYVIGAGNGEPSLTPHAELKNALFAKEIPYMNVVVSASGEKNASNLRWRARSALAFGSAPVILPPAVTYPNLFKPSDFKPGMLVKVTTDDGFLDLTGAEYVITKVSVEVGLDGSDRLTLDMIPSSLFVEVEEEEANG